MATRETLNKLRLNALKELATECNVDITMKKKARSSTETRRKVKNFRCLDRAAKHYDAGYIQDITFAQVDERTVYIKAACRASKKKIIYNRLPEAIQWGIDNESRAKKDYADLKAVLCTYFEIEATGLTLCKTRSFMGASGDGRITDETGTGVLEVKCPFSVGGTNVTDMQVSDAIALLSSSGSSLCQSLTKCSEHECDVGVKCFLLTALIHAALFRLLAGN
ncbi:hypothetical protein KUTeg_022569 [Tegillarca granosa]|uniref:YqaJ viral recombinase domain-containing protein n=1 Tax=Tegillarca granosa TaxID=220873 RepID=A0ABQ9EC67_TEGGR|nr:hypothetical protein KUTeg_022569 [Tegillarca granosa]